MSRRCDVTGTKSQRGKKIALIWGVKYRSIKHRFPNLRKIVAEVDGKLVKLTVSSKALKSIKLGKFKGIKFPDYPKAIAPVVEAVVAKE